VTYRGIRSILAGSGVNVAACLPPSRVGSGELAESVPASPQAAGKAADKTAADSVDRTAEKSADRPVQASPDSATDIHSKLAMTSRGPKIAS